MAVNFHLLAGLAGWLVGLVHGWQGDVAVVQRGGWAGTVCYQDFVVAVRGDGAQAAGCAAGAGCYAGGARAEGVEGLGVGEAWDIADGGG